MNKKHHDCRNFVPVDVAKGICLVNNMEVLIDTDVCEKFTALPKCKICSNFTNPDADNIGTCKGFKDNAWTFGDLRAVNCEEYAAK